MKKPMVLTTMLAMVLVATAPALAMHPIVVGTDGPDEMRGEGGDDVLEGGEAKDKVRGGSGNDTLAVGLDADPDKAYGGPGEDTISAQDASTDAVDCGTGCDRVTTDASNQVKKDLVASNCEQVFIPPPGDV